MPAPDFLRVSPIAPPACELDFVRLVSVHCLHHPSRALPRGVLKDPELGNVPFARCQATRRLARPSRLCSPIMQSQAAGPSTVCCFRTDSNDRCHSRRLDLGVAFRRGLDALPEIVLERRARLVVRKFREQCRGPWLPQPHNARHLILDRLVAHGLTGL